MEIGKIFLWTYGQMDVRMDDTPEFQSTRSSVGDDLKIKWYNHKTEV